MQKITFLKTGSLFGGRVQEKKRKRILSAVRKEGLSELLQSAEAAVPAAPEEALEAGGGRQRRAVAASPPSLRLVFQELELSAQCSVSDPTCLAELVFKDLQSALPGGRSSVSDFPQGPRWYTCCNLPPEVFIYDP